MLQLLFEGTFEAPVRQRPVVCYMRPETPYLVNSSSFYPGGYHHVEMFQSNNQLFNTVHNDSNSSNSNFQVQPQQLQPQQLQPQHAVPGGRIYVTEMASFAVNDLASLVSNPPIAPVVGGGASLTQ